MVSQIFDTWNNLHFAEPENLYLLGPAALLFIAFFIIWALRLYQQPKETIGSRYPLVGTIKLWFFTTVMLALLIIAWARPFLDKANISIRRGSVEVMFVLDASSSMFLKDIGSARIDVATREIIKLLSLDILRNEDRAGLVVFGKTSVRRVHLTSDLNRFAGEVLKIGRPKNFIDNEMSWSTDLKSALEQTYQSLDSQDMFAELGEDPDTEVVKKWQSKKRSNRLVFLFSDFDYTPKREEYADDETYENDLKLLKSGLINAFAELKKRGLVIYPVGIGSLEGESLIDILKDYKPSEYYENLPTEIEGQFSKLDMANLEYIEKSTSGKKYVMTTSGADASDYLRRIIDSHRSMTIEPSSNDEKQELWLYFLFAALAVFAIAAILY